MSNFFIAFHCEISKNAAQIFVVLQKRFAALQSKSIETTEPVGCVVVQSWRI